MTLRFSARSIVACLWSRMLAFKRLAETRMLSVWREDISQQTSRSFQQSFLCVVLTLGELCRDGYGRVAMAASVHQPTNSSGDRQLREVLRPSFSLDYNCKHFLVFEKGTVLKAKSEPTTLTILGTRKLKANYSNSNVNMASGSNEK